MGKRQDEWIEQAKREGYSYIVGCGDSFDNSYYPCFCKTKEEAEQKAREVRASSMQTVFEIIEVKKTKRAYKREYTKAD